MKESNNEGVAIHVGPESWAAPRKGYGQALTGERAGWAIELRNEIPQGELRTFWVPTSSEQAEGNTLEAATCEASKDPAQSKTPCTHGHTTHGNREIPRPVCTPCADRIGKSKDSRR